MKSAKKQWGENVGGVAREIVRTNSEGEFDRPSAGATRNAAASRIGGISDGYRSAGRRVWLLSAPTYSGCCTP